MKKNEAIDEGRRDGTTEAQKCLAGMPELLNPKEDYDAQMGATQDCAAGAAVEWERTRKIRSPYYVDAFVSAFVAEWRRQYNEQPEVKAKRRLEHVVVEPAGPGSAEGDG